MFIVLEGPRNAGKTTIAKELQRQLSRDSYVRYIHHGPGESTVQQIWDETLDLFHNRNTVTIYDRWWLSEFVYVELQGHDTTLPYTIYELEALIGCRIEQLGLRYLINTPTEVLLERGEQYEIKNSAAERNLYLKYADYHWRRLDGSQDLSDCVDTIHKDIEARYYGS